MHACKAFDRDGQSKHSALAMVSLAHWPFGSIPRFGLCRGFVRFSVRTSCLKRDLLRLKVSQADVLANVAIEPVHGLGTRGHTRVVHHGGSGLGL